MLVGYAGVVGGGASVVRATLMAVIYLLARQADHRGSPMNALAVAAALLLLASPSSVADVGFWLTFGATLGIMVGRRAGGPPAAGACVAARCRRRCCSRRSARNSRCSRSARSPSRASRSPASLLNFVAIPMMSVVQVAGMAAVPLSSLAWDAGADAAGFVAHLGAAGLVRSASLVDLAPWLTYRLPPPHALAIAGYYAAWAAWLAARATAAAASGPARCRVVRGDRPGRWPPRAAPGSWWSR